MTMKVAPQYLETQFKLPLLLCTPKTKILVKEGLKKLKKTAQNFHKLVRSGWGDPPTPPKAVSLTAFTQFF